jgi:hypothetical protein
MSVVGMAPSVGVMSSARWDRIAAQRYNPRLSIRSGQAEGRGFDPFVCPRSEA